MTYEELRLECVRLAINDPRCPDVIPEAGRLFDFITGQAAKTPRQLIDEALEQAGVR